MKIGFYATGSGTGSYQDLLDQIQYADEVGFDAVWLRERHFHPDHPSRNLFSSPFVASAYIAAKTKRIRIGMACRILPLDHPIHIAEDGATIDIISNGRLDLGIARVGENDLYQRAFGIPTDETRDRFEEALEVIIRAWTEERFAYDGMCYKIPPVSVYPKPLQKPHPPIYLAGISQETFAFGAKWGLPLISASAQTVAVVKKTQEAYYRLLEENDYRREDVVLPIGRFIYVAETDQQAVEETKGALEAFIHRGGSAIRDYLFLPHEAITYDLLANEVFILGGPDTCLKKLGELEETLDLWYLILTFNYYTIDDKKCFQSMERFVRYVMPHLQGAISY